MQRMAAWNETFVFLVAFVCFTSILEMMHLLRFNAKMSMLALTLKRSTKELLYFSVTFIITFMAFAQFAFLGEKRDRSLLFAFQSVQVAPLYFIPFCP